MLSERPDDFVEGVGYGISRCLNTIVLTGYGFFSRPYIEARRNGAKGFALGCYQGTAGGLFKISSGCLDLVSKSFEGVKNSFRTFESGYIAKRIRNPRPFYGKQRLMKVYNWSDAVIISDLLCTVADGAHENDSFIQQRVICSYDKSHLFLILTEEHLMLVEAQQKQLYWVASTQNLDRIEDAANGLVLYLKFELPDGRICLPLYLGEDKKEVK